MEIGVCNLYIVSDIRIFPNSAVNNSLQDTNYQHGCHSYRSLQIQIDR